MVPPGDSALIIGDPYVKGFNKKWFAFKGGAGETYTLLTAGDGSRLDGTFAAGGLKGKATFVRAITFTRGAARAKAILHKQGGKWVLTGEPGQAARATGQGKESQLS